ncbi:hypothetical protein D9758_011115 [Tetrapyrgos nigripes]|uniref:C2 NT-type domain-containing protein n=1 Tax=Tetrapyrgos nigripes TaxID=182062 RepID=A0A8H5CJV5_9AGAR|nr:hypothetical protein D9758_011115 [Tetrapyrgos nigripes]
MPSLTVPNVEHPFEPQPSTSSQSHGKLRAQLQNLLPRHALFYAKIEIHQITSVPLVYGEFAVRWRFKHAQNKLALKKILKSRIQGRKDKVEEGGADEENEKEDSQGTPIPSVIVSDVAQHMGYTGLTSHITTSPSPLASRSPSYQSSSTASSTSTSIPSAVLTHSNLTHFLSTPSTSTSASFSSSALASNPGSLTSSLSGTPNNHNHTSSHLPHTPNNSPNPSTLQRIIPSDISTYSPSRGITSYNKLVDHSVSWNHVLHTVLKIPIDRETNMLEPSPLKLVVTQRVVHGDPDAPKQPRLGAIYLDLSEYAGVGGEVERRYLLAECRMNVVIKLTTHLVPLTPDIHYTCPPLPKAEILNGVTDILDTDIDIFHTRPRGLDLWGPFFRDHDLEGAHTHAHEEEDEEDISHAHISSEKRTRSTPSMNGSPNSKTRTYLDKGKGKEKEKDHRSRSRSRARNASGHSHRAYSWARKFGLDFSDTDGSEDFGSEEDEDEDGIEYASSPEEEEDDEEYVEGLHMRDAVDVSGATATSASASSSRTQRSKSSTTSKSSYSDASGSHSHEHHGHPHSHHHHPHNHHSNHRHHSNSHTPLARTQVKSTSPKKNQNHAQKKGQKSPPGPAIDSVFDVSKLPLAYGPKTTELLIDALFNPVTVVVPKADAHGDHSKGKDKESEALMSVRTSSTENRDKTPIPLGHGQDDDKSPKLPLSSMMSAVDGPYTPFTTIVEVEEDEVKKRAKDLEGYEVHIGDGDGDQHLEDDSLAHHAQDIHLQDGIPVPIVDRNRTVRRRKTDTNSGDLPLGSMYSAGSPRTSIENDRVSSKSSSASTRSGSGSFSGSGSRPGSRLGSHDGHGDGVEGYGHAQGQDRRGRGLGMNVRGWWSKMRLGQQGPGGQDTVSVLGAAVIVAAVGSPGSIELSSRPGIPAAMTSGEEEKMVMGTNTGRNDASTSQSQGGLLGLGLRLGSSNSVSQLPFFFNVVVVVFLLLMSHNI